MKLEQRHVCFVRHIVVVIEIIQKCDHLAQLYMPNMLHRNDASEFLLVALLVTKSSQWSDQMHLEFSSARFIEDLGLSADDNAMYVEASTIVREHKVGEFSFISKSMRRQNDESDGDSLHTLRWLKGAVRS